MDVVSATILFSVLGCATAVLFWSQVVFSYRKRDVLHRYEEAAEGESVVGTVRAQPIRRLAVNCVPITTRHVVSFVYQVPNTQEQVLLTRRRIYNGCSVVTPFTQAFTVRVIEGLPRSGYPDDWVQNRTRYFRPGILPMLACLYGMTVFPGIVGQGLAGTLNTDQPLPFFYIIPVAILFLAVGFPIAFYLFTRWEEDLLGEKRPSIFCSSSTPEYVGVETIEQQPIMDSA